MTGFTRRSVTLLPFLLVACGGDEHVDDSYFVPLRFSYLPPIQLNVSDIEIQQRFIPAGVSPDVSSSDPISPIDALKDMAKDRLQALGTSNKAIFAILDASMTRQSEVIRGQMTVSLTIYDGAGTQVGFAQAHVERSHSGGADDLRRILYDMTKAMMDDMNIEFEYQVRRNLKEWLTSPVVPGAPVEQAPLDQMPPS